MASEKSPPPMTTGPTPPPVMHNSQPAPMQAMNSSGFDPRNPHNLALDPEGHRHWSHGLCDCCDDPGECFKAWCCPCITYGNIAMRRKALELTGRPSPPGASSTGDCLTYCLLVYFTGFGGAILGCLQRGKIRQRYNVAGNWGVDCLSHFFCTPCALVQENREVDEEEKALNGQWSGQKV